LQSPGEHNLPFKDVKIKTKDNEVLHGWFIFQENSHLHKTVVYFHENAGSNIINTNKDIGFRIPLLIELFRSLKVNILIVAYRG
jgi:hypothetical protein